MVTKVEHTKNSHRRQGERAGHASSSAESAAQQLNNHLSDQFPASSVAEQAGHLHDPRLLTAQRQQFARSINERQGNQHLQQVMGLSLPEGVIQLQPEVGPSTEEQIAKAEEEKKEFRQGQYSAKNFRPSTGLGNFDADYDPNSGAMRVILKIGFDFKDARDVGVMDRLLETETYKNGVWTDEEKAAFIEQFTGAAEAKWGKKFQLTCNKLLWDEFVTSVSVVVVGMAGGGKDSHYNVTINKIPEDLKKRMESDPTARPRAEVFAPPKEQPGEGGGGAGGAGNEPGGGSEGSGGGTEPETAKPGSGQMYEGDTELRPSNQSGVVNDEKNRLDDGINAAKCSQVTFDLGKSTVRDAGPIQQFASVLKEANPSAPALPVNITGYIDPSETDNSLAQARADAVAMVLAGEGIPQPMSISAFVTEARGPKVALSISESSQNQNLRRVSDHEIGHMLGLPDEYAAQGGERNEEHQNAEAVYEGMVKSAGVNQPAMGRDTSSIMSVGVDVMAAHYVTIREALGKMTAKYITTDQWSISG